MFLDISDPAHPKEAGRFWLPGQKEGEPAPPQPISFHGPAIIDGNKAYLGYGYSIVTLDITDIASPKMLGRLDVSPPFKGGGQSVHGCSRFLASSPSRPRGGEWRRHARSSRDMHWAPRSWTQ